MGMGSDGSADGMGWRADTTKRNGFDRLYFGNGRLKEESEWKNGFLVGYSRKWHRNGMLAEEVPHLDGQVHGVVRQWDAQGKLLGTCEIVHGLGLRKKWNEDGTLYSEAEIHPDLLIKITMYLDQGRRKHSQHTYRLRKITGKKFTDLLELQRLSIANLPPGHPPVTAGTKLLSEPKPTRKAKQRASEPDGIPGPWGQGK